MARLPRIPGTNRPGAANESTMRAVRRSVRDHHAEDADARSHHADAMDRVRQTWQDVAHAGHLDDTHTKAELTKVEVIERVPRPWQWLLQSKWLGGLARVSTYGRDSFTWTERAHGEHPHNRKAPRYYVTRRLGGYVLPYTLRGELPDARKAHQFEQMDRTSLILGDDGESSWAKGIWRHDGKAILVGRDVPTIGIDTRPVDRPGNHGPLTRLAHWVLRHPLDFDTRPFPNEVGGGLETVTAIDNHMRPAEVGDKIDTLNAVHEQLRALGGVAIAPRPPAPPYTHGAAYMPPRAR